MTNSTCKGNLYLLMNLRSTMAFGNLVNAVMDMVSRRFVMEATVKAGG